MPGPKQVQDLKVSNRALNSTNVPMEVAVLDGSGNQVTSFGSGGTQYTEGDQDATITGMALVVEKPSSNELAAVQGSTEAPASDAFGMIVRVAGSLSASTQVSVREIQTSSGASVMDSTAGAIKVNVVAGSVAGDTSVTVSTGSVRVHQSTAADLNVTVAGYVAPSTIQTISTGSVRVHQSTAADLNVTVAGYVAPSTIQTISTGSVRVHQSTAADLNVTVAGYVAPSTGPLSISSIAGPVTVRSSAADFGATVQPLAGSTWAVRPLQSSQADLRVTAYQSTAGDFHVTATPLAGSTWSVRPLQSSQADLRVTVYQSTAADLLGTVNVRDGSGNTLESGVTAPSTGARGLFVRPVLNDLKSVVSTNAFASTVLSLISSNASLRGKVYGYAITTTNTASVDCGFYSGATLRWNVRLQAVSGGIVGAVQTVTPPAWLFHADTGAALTLNTSGSTTAGWSVSVAYFQE